MKARTFIEDDSKDTPRRILEKNKANCVELVARISVEEERRIAQINKAQSGVELERAANFEGFFIRSENAVQSTSE